MTFLCKRPFVLFVLGQMRQPFMGCGCWKDYNRRHPLVKEVVGKAKSEGSGVCLRVVRCSCEVEAKEREKGTLRHFFLTPHTFTHSAISPIWPSASVHAQHPPHPGQNGTLFLLSLPSLLSSPSSFLVQLPLPYTLHACPLSPSRLLVEATPPSLSLQITALDPKKKHAGCTRVPGVCQQFKHATFHKDLDHLLHGYLCRHGSQLQHCHHALTSQFCIELLACCLGRNVSVSQTNPNIDHCGQYHRRN